MTNDVNSIKKILQGKSVIEEPDDGSGKIILFTAIGVFIIIMILKVLLFIYYMVKGQSTCDMMNEWLNC